MERSVIIIGAGIAGLSAGCYARMNGYPVRIFEMGDKPGGLCTAWERKSYTIDGCLHWLVGSAEGSAFYPIWLDLGVLQGKQIVNPEQLCRFEDANDQVFTLYTDTDLLERHMRSLSPEDSRHITRVCRALRKLGRLEAPVDKAPELYTVLDGIKMMVRLARLFPELRRWGPMTVGRLAEQFKSPLLRNSWLQVWPEQSTALFILVMVGMMERKVAGYMIGGSDELSRAIERRYLALGGELAYKARVEKIIVEDKRAVGVRLADGAEHRADVIISAADGHATIFEMLEGRYLNERIRSFYQRSPIFQPLVYVALGVNRTFADTPQVISGITFELDEPVYLGGLERKWLNVRVHNFDATLAPSGRTLLTLMLESRYEYWANLRRDPARYRQEKDRIAETVIRLLSKRFPNLSRQVEMVDVATPVTFQRYTGNWQGSYEGWVWTPRLLMTNMSKTLPGLGNFYMAGHWVQPGGGLPVAAMSGRHVIQLLCKRDKKRFQTSQPAP